MAVSSKTMKEYPVTCHCGSPAHLRDNSLLYNGKSYGNGKAYICDTFPKCRGSVGVHPNGKPLGSIPDDETKKLRMAVHAIIDPLWQNQPYQPRRRARRRVYVYLASLLEMNAEECHVGNFDAQTCKLALKRIEENPYEVRA